MNRQNHTGPYILAATCLLLALAANKSMPRTEASARHNTAAQSVSMRGTYKGKLVFTSDRHNVGLNIWTMNPDGSSPTRLTVLST